MIALLPPGQLATQLHVSAQTVRRHVDEGSRSAVRVGRLLRVSLEPLPATVGALSTLLERSHYSAAELAAAWTLHVETLHRLARRGHIPLVLRQGQWVISRRALAAWLARSLRGDRA